MRTSQRGVDLIKEFEGFHAEAYVCSAGTLTIGYGHTGEDFDSTTVYTKGEAEGVLNQDLRAFEEGVQILVGVSLDQGQFDALVSFSYDLGLNVLAGSELLAKINSGDYDGAADLFKKWAGEDGEQRRKAEERVFRCGGLSDRLCERYLPDGL